jgi:anti-anti-sigma factor
MRFARSESEPFRCEVEPERESVRVCPIGELDLATVALLDAELAELWAVGFTRIVLDLRELQFMDSSGVRLLLSWRMRSSADGFAFDLIPGAPSVQRVLELADAADRLLPDGSAQAAAARAHATRH